ncbi:hypothetical protein KAU32_01680 [bacterium]|nr:hypothetical protein [bacterium]
MTKERGIALEDVWRMEACREVNNEQLGEKKGERFKDVWRLFPFDSTPILPPPTQVI